MERPAKERLIGAVVIVTVAWLLIPVFLDEGGGEADNVVARELALPDPERGDGATMRRETVALDTSQAGTAVAPAPEPAAVTALPVPETTSAPAGRDTPPPAETVPEPVAETRSEADAPADSGGQAARKPEPRREPATSEAEAGTPVEPPPQGASATGGGQLWAVQLGSFSDRDNAQRLAGQLRDQGYPAFLSQVERGGRTLHRVRVGPQASREAAADVAARLKSAGQSAAVVPHP